MRNTPQAGSNDPTWPDAAFQAQPVPPAYAQQPVQPQPYAPPPMQPYAQPSPAYPQPPRRPPYTAAPIARILRGLSQVVALALGIVESLLLLRIILFLLAANPAAGFSNLIFEWTAPLVQPFQGVFPNVLGSSGPALDVAAILAMIVFALLARAVEAALRVLARL